MSMSYYGGWEEDDNSSFSAASSESLLEVGSSEMLGLSSVLTIDQKLYNACERGDLELVQELISHGADFNYVNTEPDGNMGGNCLHIASWRNNKEIVKYLLTLPTMDVNKPNNLKQTPLYLACRDEKIDAATLLLQHPKVDTNTPDEHGCTPLWAAARNNNSVELFERLLVFGTNVNWNCKGLTNDEWLTPLQIATIMQNYNLYNSKKTHSLNAKKRQKVMYAQVVSFLRRVERNYDWEKRKCQRKYQVQTRRISDLFVLILLFSDNYFALNASASTNVSSFFNIAKRLPTELRMMISHRCFNSTQEFVKSTEVKGSLIDIFSNRHQIFEVAH